MFGKRQENKADKCTNCSLSDSSVFSSTAETPDRVFMHQAGLILWDQARLRVGWQQLIDGQGVSPNPGRFVQVLQIGKGGILQLTAAVGSRGDWICLVLQHIWAELFYTLEQQEVLCVFVCLGGHHPSGKLPAKQSVHNKEASGNLHLSHMSWRRKDQNGISTARGGQEAQLSLVRASDKIHPIHPKSEHCPRVWGHTPRGFKDPASHLHPSRAPLVKGPEITSLQLGFFPWLHQCHPCWGRRGLTKACVLAWSTHHEFWLSCPVSHWAAHLKGLAKIFPSI